MDKDLLPLFKTLSDFPEEQEDKAEEKADPSGWFTTHLPEKAGSYLVTYKTRTGRLKVEQRWYSGYCFSKGNGGFLLAWKTMPEPYRPQNSYMIDLQNGVIEAATET